MSRLETYLGDLHRHITTKVTKEIGGCKPLWDIFRLARFFTCKLIVDPTTAISASSFILTLLFLGVVIVVLNLVEHYRELNEELLTSITHRRARDGLIIDDEGTWASPSLETPPDVEMRNNGQGEQATWVSPTSRQSVELLIPPPPRALQGPSRSRSPKR
ncbi:hypothetical protein Zmor_000087 [Zophobas morio]|nr:hypothetical protein Zmor_000087 [Zophobas morio]